MSDVEKQSVSERLQRKYQSRKNLKKAEARIKYLEAENEFLKKLEELERQA